LFFPATTTTTTGTLTFDKTQNTSLTRIPANYRIQTRPIPHAPVASPYAGTHVPKIVYVGSKTPFMSAIKRVQKLLHLAERRAMAPLVDEKAKKRRQQQQQHNQHGSKRGGDQGGDDAEKAVLEECLRKLRQEKVFIKATGRAIEKALALGGWFQEKAQEYEVGIRTGSVCVVDDIVRLEEDGVNVFTVVDPPTTTKEDDESDSDAVVDDADAMDTTMGNSDDAGDNAEDSMDVDDAMDIDAQQQQQQPAESKNQRRRRRRRDRERQHRLQASLDSDGEPPESRTRWISMIEVAVSLK
jgi:ribonuclease P/MRP protein subunit POP7